MIYNSVFGNTEKDAQPGRLARPAATRLVDCCWVDFPVGSGCFAANDLVRATHVVSLANLMADFNPNHKIVLDNLLLTHPLVRAGKMFGFPAYYVGRKLCICLYEESVGIKLPAPSVARLLESDPNAIPFQPMGKPKMSEWVQINLDDSEAYVQYETVFHEHQQKANP